MLSFSLLLLPPPELRSISQTERVLRLICKSSGYLGPDEELASLKQPPNPDSPYGKVHDGAIYPCYKMQGRNDADLVNHNTFLSKTYALECVKDKPNLHWQGGISACCPEVDAFEVQYDHIDDLVITSSEESGGLEVTQVDGITSRFHLRTGTVPPFAHLQLSEGWLTYAHFGGEFIGDNAFDFWCFERLAEVDQANQKQGKLVHKGILIHPNPCHESFSNRKLVIHCMIQMRHCREQFS